MANKKVLQEIMNEVDDIIIVYTVLYSSYILQLLCRKLMKWIAVVLCNHLA